MNMFSRLFKKTSLTNNTNDKFMKERESAERVELFLGNRVVDRVTYNPVSAVYLGHTTSDSPVSATHDVESGTKNVLDDTKYFQEAFVDNYPSPGGSYVDVTDTASKCFDPRDVNTCSDSISTFIRLPLEMSLLSVPGIDVNNNNLMEKEGIYNTHQLIGQFLVLRGNMTSHEDIADKFYSWLGEIGVHTNRATITAAIAEKIGTWIPGIYDISVYKLW